MLTVEYQGQKGMPTITTQCTPILLYLYHETFSSSITAIQDGHVLRTNYGTKFAQYGV